MGDLTAAAEVTESYIAQLLTRKKLPPAPNRWVVSSNHDRASVLRCVDG